MTATTEIKRGHRWKGGRKLLGDRYVLIRNPGHARAQSGYVYEHVLVAEQALGRPLSGKHPVHHVDENGMNNAGSNLVVCENGAYHKLLHKRKRAFEACGDPNAVFCYVCHGYDRQSEMHMYVTRTGNRIGNHRECRRVAATEIVS